MTHFCSYEINVVTVNIPSDGLIDTLWVPAKPKSTVVMGANILGAEFSAKYCDLK